MIKAHNHRMICDDYRYIWEADDWPHWRYDLAGLAGALAELSRMQGVLSGRLADVGMGVRDAACLTALTEEVLQTSAIEGETLSVTSVRSSIARRLGVDIGALAPVDRHVEGVVDMVLDATTNLATPLSEARLFGWHAALFPTGYSSFTKLRVGAWRDDATGPMQVVSGLLGRQRVHYEAPPAERLVVEVRRFLDWVNQPGPEPPLIKAALGHLWFVTLHPFDDGNGRIARAIGDWLLARADGSSERFYSVSAQIQRDRTRYYTILERTQQGTLDITAWLSWFIDTMRQAVESALRTHDAVLTKARLWQQWRALPLNSRQIKVLNKLLDGFEGKLTARKWAALARCSHDTAWRDLSELLSLGVLRKSASGGRSTHYELGS